MNDNYTPYDIPVAMLARRPPCAPGDRAASPTGAYQAKAAEEPAWLRAILEQSEPERVLVSGWPVRKLVRAI